MTTAATIPTPDEGRPWTARELAVAFGISERHVQRQAAAGKLPHHRIGGALRFLPSDLAAIEAMTAVAPSSMAADVRHGSSGRGGHRFEGAA